MKTIVNALKQLVRDDAGAQATEIALGIVLIALVAGLGMVEFGAELRDFFTNTANSIDGANPGTLPAVPAPD
jgi:Flp pilus assembly pilin Flp